MDNQRIKVKDITIAGLVAAVYALATTINPLAYGALQFRVSEMLMVLPFLQHGKRFKMPLVIGITIANAFSPFGPIDVVIGVTHAVVSFYVFERANYGVWLKTTLTSLLAGVMVGGMITYMTGAPFMVTAGVIAITESVMLTIGAGVMQKVLNVLHRRTLV